MIDVSFPFEILRLFVSGHSAIDIPKLLLNDVSETEAFLECYGYDWFNPEHREELENVRRESVSFIQEALLGEEGDPRIPDEVRDQKDVRELLVWASDPDHEYQRWACAILRVGHTYAHAHSYFNERFGPTIRHQIFSRFEQHLVRVDGDIFLGVDEKIPLANFYAKPSKPISSVMMKLLHKAENVAADIFDRVGVRFLTRERFDALLVVKYLREHNIVMFANVKPSRSRNTLIDIDWLEKELEEIDVTDPSALETIREATRHTEYPGPPVPSYNPYSAAEYHSIQFTCRQLIRTADSETGEPVRFFFPFEVQILDVASFEASRKGYAAHDLYKARQREAARQRVLGSLAPKLKSQL